MKTDQTPFFVKQIPEDRSALLRIRNYPMNLCAIHLHDACLIWMSGMNTASISGRDDSMPASIPYFCDEKGLGFKMHRTATLLESAIHFPPSF